jgi:hypothetical protein
MAKVEASAERTIDAPAEQVYGHLADMHQHPRFLPPAFSDFKVEEGGVGAGTVTRFAVTAGGRTRNYLMRIAEPESRHDVPRRAAGRQVAGSHLDELGRRVGYRRLLRAHVRAEGPAPDVPRRT